MTLKQIIQHARAVSGERELHAILVQAADWLGGLRPRGWCAIQLFDGEARAGVVARRGPAAVPAPLAAIGDRLARAVVETGQALVVADVAAEPGAGPEAVAGAFCGAPVVVGGIVAGVVSLLLPGGAPPVTDDAELLSLLAAELAMAVRNARLCAENDARRRVSDALAEVGRLLAETADPVPVAQRIAERLGSLLEVRCAVVYRVAGDSGDLEVLALAGDSAPGFGPGFTVAAGTGVVGLAATTSAPVATADVFDDARLTLAPSARARLAASGLRAALAIPLTVRDAVIGVLSVEDKGGRQFTADDTLLAQGFAHHAALALQNAKHFSEALERLGEQEMLLAIAHEFSADTPSPEALRRVVRLLARTFGADMAGAYFLDRAREELIPVAGYHVPPALLATFLGSPFPMSRFTFLREAWETRRPVWTADYLADARFDQDFLAAHRPRSLLFAPTRVWGEVVGGLFLVWWRAEHSFTPAALRLVEAVATQVGLALENADLARQRQREDANGEAHRRFQTLVETASEAVALFSPAGLIEYASPVTTRVLGYALDELLGRSACELAHPDDIPALTELFKELVKTPGETVAGQYRLRHKDGSWRWVEGVGTNLLSEPSVRAIVATYRDVTRRKETEATQRMDVAGQLAGGVAHDFNNLLTVILGRSQLLRKRLGPADPMRREVDLIETTAARAATLTEQLLAFSRRQLLRPQVLDVNAAVDLLLPKLRRLSGDDIVILSLRAPSPVYITADPVQLEHALMHLALNARDAMAEGGTLAIAVSTTTLTPEHVWGHPGARPGPHVAVAVRDTGHGMTVDVQSRVFEPFFTTRGPRGRVGLGLSTVYGIVSQHGGLATIDSTVGQGTTFTLYFPEVGAAAVTGPAPPVAPAAGHGVILLVDDEAHVRELARDMLELGGYTVLEARDGAHAIQISEQHAEPIDLLVTDVVMPGLNGPALAEQLLPLRPQLRVLYVSGYPADVLAGADLTPGRAILAKPFTQASLLGAVRERLA